jgi:K+-sensing histidine kinase KdpD
MGWPALNAWAAPAAVWALAWALMLQLDALGQFELGYLALVMVLASALAGLWLGALASLLACAAAVLAFNWLFVAPRGTLRVEGAQDALLLITMLVVSGIVAWLMARQRQLAQAREQAQVQQLRNTLLASIAHDFRTPLATVLGAASSLHDQGERLSPEQRRELARRIMDEVAQLSRQAENTLQLARLATPGVGLALRLDWQSVEELVGAVLRRVRLQHPQRQIQPHVAPNLPLLRCDALLLTQLLENLLDNALKYSPAAEPVILAAWREEKTVRLSVADRGPGVPHAWRERIFDAFQRGPKPASSGAGLGLALCQAIAHAHGGHLVHRARRSGGSRFDCDLPIHPQQPAPQPLPALPETPDGS